MLSVCGIRLVALVVVCVPLTTEAALTSDELEAFRSRGVTILDEGSTYRLISTGLPPTSVSPIDGHMPVTQNYDVHIYKTPRDLTTAGCLNMGPVAFAINGVPIFSPYAPAGHNLIIDGTTYERRDFCNGSLTHSGQYHYRGFAPCLFADIFHNTVSDEAIMAIALDGYPIYISGSSGDVVSGLDACHGKFVNGRYRYYATREFPYYLGCYRAFVFRSADMTEDDLPASGVTTGMTGVTSAMSTSSMGSTTMGSLTSTISSSTTSWQRPSTSDNSEDCFYANVSKPFSVNDLTRGVLNNGADCRHYGALIACLMIACAAVFS